MRRGEGPMFPGNLSMPYMLANFMQVIWLGDCSIRQLLLDNYLWWNWGSEMLVASADKHLKKMTRMQIENWICLTSKSVYTSLIICFGTYSLFLHYREREGHGGPPAFSTLWGQRRLTLVFRGEHTTVDRWETTVLPWLITGEGVSRWRGEF